VCDYSLHGVASRPARVADALVTTRFNNFSGGFAAVGEPHVAVCLMPGAEVAFERPAVRDLLGSRLLAWIGLGRLGTVARFRQVNKDLSSTHHDALEFANGITVLLTKLRPGQRARVLQLPASEQMQSRQEPAHHTLVTA